MFFWEKQKVITALYLQYTKPICERNNLTQMEYDILMFLSEHPDMDTAADITRERKFTKSHVSSAIHMLKLKGLIHRRDTESRRNIHIRLTEKASDIVATGMEAQQEFLRRIFQGFSQEELDSCIAFFHRLCDNASACLMEAQA